MKKLLVFLLVVGVLVGGYYVTRLYPLVTTDNAGADKVVLLHGLGRGKMSTLLLESALTKAGFDVHSIDYPSTDQAPEALVEIISQKIDDCCSGGPETVHFVGHSLGGLLIRTYLGRNQPSNLGRVVLLGTPNKGSELADTGRYQSVSNTLLELAGPAAKALNTGPNSFPASLPTPHFPVGVIAGTQDNPVSNQWLPLPNDGMVSVESARLDGMTDFIDLDVNHWGLRTEPDVASQVVEFLLHESFDHSSTDN